MARVHIKVSIQILALILFCMTLLGCGGGGLAPSGMLDDGRTIVDNSGQQEQAAANGEEPEALLTGQDPLLSELEALRKPNTAKTTTTMSRSVKLNTYNNPFFKNDYGWTYTQMIEVLARKDRVRLSESWPVSVGPDVKRLNPNARIDCYYALSVKNQNDDDRLTTTAPQALLNPVTKTEMNTNDWWLRDGNGQIVKETETSWFVDVGKPGYKEAYLKNMLQRLSYRKFDGVVLDYWLVGIKGSYLGAFMVNKPMPAAYPTDEDWFNKAWKPFIQYVCTGLRSAGYRVIGNCAGEYGTTNVKQQWQRTMLDGTVYEQFAVDWPSRGGTWLKSTTIEKRINAVLNDPLEVWAADYGLRTTDPEYDRKQRVALAMYYISIPSGSLNRHFYNQCANRSVYWEKIWDVRIGTPAEMPVKMTGQYFWSRRYTNGMVLLNYNDTASVTYTLPTKYADPDGNIRSGAITVPAHTGLILANYTR